MGRYPTILLSLLELAIFGFGTAFVSSFNQYIFFRFCVSQAVMGYTIGSSALREAGRWGRGAGGGALGRGGAGAHLLGTHRTVGVVAQPGSQWRLRDARKSVPTLPLYHHPPGTPHISPFTLLTSPTWLMLIQLLRKPR